jgi:hypothetical protein
MWFQIYLIYLFILKISLLNGFHYRKMSFLIRKLIFIIRKLISSVEHILYGTTPMPVPGAG